MFKSIYVNIWIAENTLGIFEPDIDLPGGDHQELLYFGIIQPLLCTVIGKSFYNNSALLLLYSV